MSYSVHQKRPQQTLTLGRTTSLWRRGECPSLAVHLSNVAVERYCLAKQYCLFSPARWVQARCSSTGFMHDHRHAHYYLYLGKLCKRPAMEICPHSPEAGRNPETRCDTTTVGQRFDPVTGAFRVFHA